jgi:hypothetical protein
MERVVARENEVGMRRNSCLLSTILMVFEKPSSESTPTILIVAIRIVAIPSVSCVHAKLHGDIARPLPLEG